MIEVGHRDGSKSFQHVDDALEYATKVLEEKGKVKLKIRHLVLDEELDIPLFAKTSEYEYEFPRDREKWQAVLDRNKE